MSYDGAIRINTQIDIKKATAQLATIENKMVKTADEIASLKNKMDALSKTKIPTAQYVDLQKDLAVANEKLEALYNRQKQYADMGFKTLPSGITEELDKAGLAVGDIELKMQSLVDTGKAFTLGSDTEEYSKLNQKLAYANGHMQELQLKHDEIQNKQSKTTKNTIKWDSTLKSTVSTLDKINKKVNSFTSSLIKGMGNAEKSVKKTNGLLSIMGSRLKGITLSLLVFNWITRGFNAALSAISNGFKDLALYSADFNSKMSQATSSAQTLKNSLAAAAMPIANFAIPYISRFLDLITECLNRVNQLIAALSGKTTWTKAVKVQQNYAEATKETAEATKDAAEAAKGALRPFDLLNNMQSDKKENESGGNNAGVGTGSDLYEEIPIDTGIFDVAEKIKTILGKLFEPLKKAWDREGQGVVDAWREALEEIKLLVLDIGRDFLIMWRQDETVDMFADILVIVKDIGLVLKNIAKNFRKAWNEDSTGLHILENIRDIIAIIVENVREAADATVEWSENLDFTNLLTSFEEFTESLKPVVDFLSGILTDFYTYVLLPLAEWAIEKGIPDLIDIFTRLNDEVEWETLRTELKDLWDHLEPFAETVGEGVILFIEDAAIALEGFLNSQELKDFLDMVKNWMDKVEPEDVAEGLKNIANSLIGLKVTLGAFKIGTAIMNGISTLLNNLQALKAIGNIAIVVSVAFAGFEIGKELGKLLNPEDSELYDNFKWTGKGGFFDVITEDLDTTLKSVEDMMKDFENNPVIATLANGIVGPLVSGFIQGKEVIKKEFNFKDLLGTKWTDIFPSLKEWQDENRKSREAEKQEFYTWCDDIGLKFSDWFESDVKPWFSSEKWSELGGNIKTAISEKWNEFTNWWNETAIANWWKEDVTPWFTKEKWEEILSGIPDAFSSKMQSTLDTVASFVQSIIDSISSAISKIVQR